MRGKQIRPQPKSTRSSTLTRRQCVDVVYTRALWRCERCGQPVRERGCDGHVNERVPRSRGGDPRDPGNCELVCHHCHFGGPSGAHAPTKERQSTRSTGFGD